MKALPIADCQLKIALDAQQIGNRQLAIGNDLRVQLEQRVQQHVRSVCDVFRV